MKRRILITFLSVSGMLLVAAPLAARGSDIPQGETKREEAYVTCGDLDYQSKDLANPGKMVGTKAAPQPDGIVDNPCGFADVFNLARALIIGWIMAGVLIASLGFAYAGFLYITAMGSQEKISHAHMIFVKTFWGFVFMLSAWLIAKTMEQIFLTPAMQEKSFLYTQPKSPSGNANGGDPAVGGGNPI